MNLFNLHATIRENSDSLTDTYVDLHNAFHELKVVAAALRSRSNVLHDVLKQTQIASREVEDCRHIERLFIDLFKSLETIDLLIGGRPYEH